MLEGALSFVQASASAGDASGARDWATASAPPSALNVAYVTNFSFTSARTINTMSNRGLPTHHKNGGAQPIQVNATVQWTGSFTGFATASGATMPMAHAELKVSNPEEGGTGRYFQFHGIADQQIPFTEANDGDTLALSFIALGMVGPTGSGYLA